MTDPYGPPQPDQSSAWTSPTPSTPPWPAQPPPPGWQQPSPWPTQPWYGGPQPRTNGLAIAALVTGLIGLFPVGIGLGIAALVQIRKRSEAGRGMAIGGLVAAGLWALGIAGFLTLGFSGAFDTSREGDLADVASTQVGDCLTANPSGIIDCSTPHAFEIYFVGDIPRPGWPGTGKVDSIADDMCFDTFDDYVGGSYYDSDYDYTFYAPNKAEWSEGRRTVVCVVTPSGDYLTGTVKNSGG